MNARSTKKPYDKVLAATQERANFSRLRRMTEAEIARTSPPELRDLPDDFWEDAEVVLPSPKAAISLRVDQDVLDWFRQTGPRYQTRMNAVLRTYMTRTGKRAPRARRKGHHRGVV